MLEFSIQEEYSLTPQVTQSQLNFNTDQLKAFLFINFLAVSDKRLVIHSRALTTNHEDNSDSEIVFDLSDKEVKVRDISSSLGPVQDSTSFLGDAWRACRIDSFLLFTRRSGVAKLFSNFGRGEAADVVVKNPLPRISNADGYPVDIRPNAWQRVIGQDSLLPMPITDGTKTRYLCFLKVDTDNCKAEWLLSPQSKDSIPKVKISSFWKKPKTDITHETLLKIPFLEFTQGSKTYIAIQNAMFKNGRLYIFTRGMYEELHRKSRHAYSMLAHVDYDGNVLSKPFFRDHLSHKDQKKRGYLGTFTSSKKYCILKSIYRAVDDWNGKQRLFDMDTELIEEFKLPRGYSNYQLVDHYGGDFWFQEIPKPGFIIETKIVRCELV